MTGRINLSRDKSVLLAKQVKNMSVKEAVHLCWVISLFNYLVTLSKLVP